MVETLLKYLAWPGVVLILGLVALCLYRQPFSGLIARIRKLGKGGLEAAAGTQEAAVEDKPQAADEILKLFDTEVLLSGTNGFGIGGTRSGPNYRRSGNVSSPECLSV